MACLEALLTIEHRPSPPATFSLVKVPVQHGPPAGALSQAPFYPEGLSGYCFHPWCLDGWAGRQAVGNCLSGLYLRNHKV